MLSSQLPTKIPTPFASGAGSAFIQSGGVIPIPSQIGITDGAASWVDGFPPICFQAGGAPSGRDFNSLLNQLSAWTRWQGAGGSVTFDASYASAIGGYPSGALVLSTSITSAYWLNFTDNNSTNPDTATLVGGAAGGWYLCLIGQAALDARYLPIAPATTFYVSSTSGSDANDGLSTGTAFATIQHAITYISQFQYTGLVTVNVASGTYGPTVLSQTLISRIWLKGAGASTTFITGTGTGQRGLLNYGGPTLYASGFTFTAYYEPFCGNLASTSFLWNCNFGGSTSGTVALVTAYNGATVYLFIPDSTFGAGSTSAIQFNGSAVAAIGATTGAIIQVAYQDVNWTATTGLAIGTGVSFSSGTVIAQTNSAITFYPAYTSWSGSTPTGSRYSASAFGVVNTQGQSTSWIPGSTAGNPSTSGTVSSNGGLYL